MSKDTYKGLPRAKIPWFPTIEISRCISCGKRVKYCKLGVYCSKELDGKSQPVVVNPNNCVILCKGCEDICPSGAIDHPSRKKTVNLIRKLRMMEDINK